MSENQKEQAQRQNEDKQRLECVILRSLLEYPDKIGDFIDFVPIKCFSQSGGVILEAILKLNDSGYLRVETLAAELPDEFKSSQFFVNFLAALPNVMLRQLGDTLIKLHRLEVQKRLAKELEKSAAGGQVVDLELAQQELAVSTKNFMNLRQWIEYYENKPQTPQLKTGVGFLDTGFNGGIELGQLVLIGGDPEAGKTRLGVQMLEYISITRKVAFFCFEFTIQKYIETFIAKSSKANPENIIVLNEGYHIFEVADNIRSLYRQGVKVFFIDSQMRLTHSQGRNMEEEETMKFSLLARLCHSLGIVVFLVIQNAKGDKENPMGSKKGGHEASVIIRLERVPAPRDDDNQRGNLYDENKRLLMVQKNKQTGKHYKEMVFFNTQDLRFYPLDANGFAIFDKPEKVNFEYEVKYDKKEIQ